MMESTNFKIELNRILDVLCSEIYDSPFALLRENVQNAYDAILMRKQKEPSFNNGQIRINISANIMSIEDNGIGMDENSLSTNYWTAGSSGKNNEDAKKAGVVGTFGIGAMANFGVCSELEVITRAWGADVTITSNVKKEELSLSEKSITMNDSINQRGDFGTTINATLNSDLLISIDDAERYIYPYVQYLSIPVYLNGGLISQKDYQISNTEKNVTNKSGHYHSQNMDFN